jgi:hypothetical protein
MIKTWRGKLALWDAECSQWTHERLHADSQLMAFSQMVRSMNHRHFHQWKAAKEWKICWNFKKFEELETSLSSTAIYVMRRINLGNKSN